MKVLFISRSSIFKIQGGDTTQMKNTAKFLVDFEVSVDFKDKNEEIDYGKYDLIHFFNITRPSEILFHLKRTNLPFVVSTIYVNYSFYKILFPFSFRGVITKIFGSDGIEYFKILAKHILGKEKVFYLPYFFIGQRNSIKRILGKASYLLPNSESEYNRLFSRYKINTNYKVIPNGVDIDKFTYQTNSLRKNKHLLCVAKIEPLKNQYNLIKSIENTDYTLTIIGNYAPNHFKYYKKCRKIAGKNVNFISRISQEELTKYYSESEIHVLPSWFETTGLVSLEASIMGCKIVVSPNGDTKEYFKDFASYCNPESPKSILEAINKEHNKPFNDGLNKLIKSEYNWQNTAKKTYEIYLNTLKLNK